MTTFDYYTSQAGALQGKRAKYNSVKDALADIEQFMKEHPEDPYMPHVKIYYGRADNIITVSFEHYGAD